MCAGNYNMFRSCPWLNRATDWHLCVHPGGALYLYNGRQVSIHSRKPFISVVDCWASYLQRTFTEANTDESCDFINECVDILYRLCSESVNLELHYVELVLQVSQANALCWYYFVDHTNRTLFWLQKYVGAIYDIQVLRDVKVQDLSHLGAFCRTCDITGMNYIVIRLCLGGWVLVCESQLYGFQLFVAGYILIRVYL